ncbi:MAG TPA: CAP domain-containing protein [Candidatus Limnocylindrales bacterium]|nr:CAP domain-containing protein [Candidatus Limnocylindrales bacterium]
MKHTQEIAISLGAILAVIVAVFLINQISLIHSDKITAQQTNDTVAQVQNQIHLVLTGCSTDSDGSGKIDLSCPNYGVLHFARNPPIKESKWIGVQLTIDNGQYIMQYTTPTGTNQYALAPASKSDLQVLNPPSNPIQQITRSFESEKIAVGNIFQQKTQNKSGPAPTQDELYQYALQLINQDRINHGVAPVALSDSSSAQNHADDMLNQGYFSHWNTDGVKPYVTYTKLGGKGDVDENISVTAAYCPSSNCNPNTFDPFKQINDSEYGMMYNDAASSWGHRDNIINPDHTDVNIGIAYNDKKFYFVEHFENNIVKWQTVNLDGNQLHLVGKMPSGYSLNQVDVFADPDPKPLTSNDLNSIPPYNAGHYDQGMFVGVMLPRPAADSHYPECTQGKAILDTTKGEVCVDYVTYTNISTIPNGIDISPSISKWIGPGLHTVYVSLEKQNGDRVDTSSITLEYLK